MSSWILLQRPAQASGGVANRNGGCFVGQIGGLVDIGSEILAQTNDVSRRVDRDGVGGRNDGRNVPGREDQHTSY